MYFNEKHKEKVENRRDGYVYIGSYHKNEVTIDDKNKKNNNVYIRVKCPYCKREYDVIFNHFNRGSKCSSCCHTYDNSFAYYIEEELNEKLEDYWDFEENEKRGINPYCITRRSHEKIILICNEKYYHGNYITTPAHFLEGKRCPYCSKKVGKIHPKDSFGSLYPDKAKYWSPNNKKSPFEVTPRSGNKYKFICQECGGEFERNLANLNQVDRGVFCRECNSSQLEIKTKNILEKYNIDYKTQIKYEGLLGLGNGNLSYDFYLPNYNLLIECQGEQHESWQKTWITKEDFERQLEHDKRKRNYAKENNIRLLEIWYYDIDNIEEILIKELNKINKEVI
jgi:DNA-directed RNA polymerase subunit RPC12/RpoP/ribosomal protein S27E|nr:MAG TPA: restriction enzyme [Caudoviricetes sp.]